MRKKSQDWSHQFEIVFDIFASFCAKEGVKANKSALERLVGCSRGKASHWEAGQRPSLDDMLALSEKLKISIEWLRTGEGEPLHVGHAATQPVPASVQLRPIPMVGLASCGVEGWNQVTSIAVSASPLIMGENMVAVLAAGESMVPAGIASGQVCYCDPDQPVLEGDAVYVVRRDNMATIKLYLGEGERAGLIRLKGWHNADEEERRRPFTLELPREEVVQMAPVIYVRRRL